MTEKRKEASRQAVSSSSDLSVRSQKRKGGSSSPSCVSMKSDMSMAQPLSFGLDELKRSQKRKGGSSSPSCVSMKSDMSMAQPLSFGLDELKRSQKRYGGSSSPSYVSMKSDMSMAQPLSFGLDELKRSQKRKGGSSSPSCVSMKSDMSMAQPLSFGLDELKRSQKRKGGSSSPSYVSMKSDASIAQPPSFGLDELKSKSGAETSSCSVCEETVRKKFALVCGHWLCEQCASSDCGKCAKKPRRAAEQKRDEEEYPGESHLSKVKQNHKEAMQAKFTYTSEGNDDQETPLNRIYSEVIITTGEREGPHEEHTVRQMKSRLERKDSKSLKIKLVDIFTPLLDQEKPHRTVLTKGVAGIGKSYSVQKFILDWTEGTANQDTDFIFCLAFRELNLSKGSKSLRDLLTEFHPALQRSIISDSVRIRAIVILDGLDESRFQLDFKNKVVTSVSEKTTVCNLVANLIQGNLLPDAKLWITSRPAAASQIPAEYIDMVTEIIGFSDVQKEEYFKKRFSPDSSLADRIISHIRSSQSLDIMCQIPIFCWISAVLFQETFGGDEKAEIPQTLTEMMAHFLFAQTKRRNRKYGKNISQEGLRKTHNKFLLKLGKLAFVQLQNNSLIFYEEELEDCGIDIKEAVIYSGFCNAVFKKEEVFLKNVFSFVHLTIQEFFAALFVYDCFTNKNTRELGSFLDLKDKEHSLLGLLKMTVDKVLEKTNGHLDFFLRFLLGLIVEPNRRVLQGLLTSIDSCQETDKKILTYLKAIRRKDLSADCRINLFQTMVEMRDHKVKDEIQEYLKGSDQFKPELTPLHCSALAFMLLVSNNDLDVLDLKSYNTSDEGRRRLIPAVRSSRKAILADCKVTEEGVKDLAFGLKFPYLPLRELDLSNNDLKDSGVKLLCEGLSSPYCRLQILRLSGCMISEGGFVELASALKSNPSHLTELDLSYNNPGESGVKMLSELKKDPQCKLSKVNVDQGGILRMKPGLKKYGCELTLDPNTAHKNLLLSEGNRKVAWVEEGQPYPHHQERFDPCQQVLCEQGLQGRCYMEIEVFEPFTVGLTYRTIDRKGDTDDCKLGRNDKSWCLTCSVEGCHVLHRNKSVSVSSLCSRSSRVALYLDTVAGTLSFYRVSSNSQTCLHTYTAKFSEPLYPAVELHTLSSALFCQLT